MTPEILAGPDGLKIEAMFLPASATPNDPLAQRCHLAVTLAGGASLTIGGTGEEDIVSAVDLMKRELARWIEQALRQATLGPGKTATVMVGKI